jgi:hypothetical protein
VKLLDYYGHLAYIGLIGGQMLIAAGDPAGGFLLRLVGGLAWVWVGLEMRSSSIWFWSAVFVAVDAVGLWRNA